MADFAEVLRKHWRAETVNAPFMTRKELLETIAKECGIELEPKRCVLCGHEFARELRVSSNGLDCCIVSANCQSRQLVRYMEMAKQCAR